MTSSESSALRDYAAALQAVPMPAVESLQGKLSLSIARQLVAKAARQLTDDNGAGGKGEAA